METRALLVLALAVLASGCVSDTPATTGSSGKLEINQFRISDRTLNTGQQALVTLELRNHHTQDISINSLELYNTGILAVAGSDDWKDHCSPPELRPARQGLPGKMQCTWVLEAPEDLGSFRSKSVTFNLELDYNSSFSNGDDPFKLQFMPAGDIEKTDEIKKTYTNGEVEMTVSAQNPAPVKQGTVVEVRIRPVGPGRVDSVYRMEYSPSTVFDAGEDSCPERVEPAIGDKAEFSCRVEAGTGSAAVRNLVFSTSYKYVKSPSLDIEVVDR